jgi:hypothetical protein
MARDRTATVKPKTPEVPEVPVVDETTDSVDEVAEIPEETSETSETDSETVTDSEPKSRIPAPLNIPVLSDFCARYLNALDEIAEYNKVVLAEKDSEWSAPKILEKAREFAKSDDGQNVKSAIETWESLIGQAQNARRAILDMTAEKLGIQVSAVTDRNPELEGPLKEKRKIAVEIGTQLNTIAGMTTDKTASNAVIEFLKLNPLPAVGRDQTRSFSADGGKATPKYRVTVEVSKNGEVVLTEDGFTKTALALTKLHERGKAPKSDDLRTAWEAAGNTSEKTVQSPVVFENMGFHYKITKKESK